MILLKLLVVSSFVIEIENVNPVTIKIKSIKCEHDPIVYNGTPVCYIKPTRDGFGNTTAYYIFRKPAYDLWYQLKFFYKFGTIYRQFMVDVDIDICNFFKNPHKLPKMFQHLLKTMSEDFPNMIHPCPFVGDCGFKNLDVNAAAGRLIPQVVPRGYYKIMNRYHLKDNKTFLIATIEVYVDATDPLKNFEIG